MMKRFRVAGHSMSPALQPDEEVVTVDTRLAEPGNLVVFEHPRRPDMWLVKRLTNDRGWVTSDNPDDSSDDSSTLGPLPLQSLLPVVERLDAETFAQGCALLAAEDAAMAASIAKWGLPEFWNRRPGFQTLVLLILEQQVSLESGAAMYRRLVELCGPVTPETVLAAGDIGLRSIGVTRQKSSYLVDLAHRVVEGDLDLIALEEAPLKEARADLISIRGVGPWTADAYLLSAGRRPDMWPVGDRALQVGTAEVLGLASPGNEGELEILGEPWRPIRAVAARLIWHAYLSARGRVEPPDATLVHGPAAEA